MYKWWPWYVSAINFDDLNDLPSTDTIGELTCEGEDNFPSLTGNRLNIIYLSGSETTLTENESPYYVTSGVVVQANATVNIENGATIIFLDNYDITVRGNLNGCYDIDSSTNVRGLIYNETNYTHIYSNYSGNNTDGDSNVRMGSIVFEYDTIDLNINFCNVLFEGLQYGGDYATTSSIDASYDNCEFYNIDYPIKSYWFNHDISVTDSYFHDFKTNQGDNIEFDNCVFEDFADSVISNNFFSHTAYVYNSTVIDTLGSASYCIASERGGDAVFTQFALVSI